MSHSDLLVHCKRLFNNQIVMTITHLTVTLYLTNKLKKLILILYHMAMI